jgi:hypothetical protein
MPGYSVKTAWSPTVTDGHTEGRRKRGGKGKTGRPGDQILIDPVTADRGDSAAG